MGTLYSVLPLSGETRDYVLAEGLSCPAAVGRPPTVAEIRHALATASGIVCEAHERDGKLHHIVLTSTDPRDAWAALNIGEHLDERSPVDLWFEKGWIELMLRFLVSISRATGPLVLIADSGELPIVVSGDTDVQAILASRGESD